MSLESAAVNADMLVQNAEGLLERRDLRAAAEAFYLAEQKGADADRCSAGRWMVHMLQGDLLSAWLEGDAIRARGVPDPNSFWHGESISGKRVIVRCLHGLGDAVQMLRYLPGLCERCAAVTVEVPPRLFSLAPFFAGAAEVITWGDDAPIESPAWDLQLEVMELPYLFRTAATDLPVARSYLQLPQKAILKCLEEMQASAVPRVGVVWSASDWDPTRCLPMDCLSQVLAVPGIEFWNLQGGRQHMLTRGSATLAKTRDAALLGEGLVTLAAVIANMDLVLTVDTLAAHLTGAMGKTAWVMLQYRADWRWMHGRKDSPWYPSLRLWRQPSQDDWCSLTARVCEGLRSWQETKR